MVGRLLADARLDVIKGAGIHKEPVVEVVLV